MVEELPAPLVLDDRPRGKMKDWTAGLGQKTHRNVGVGHSVGIWMILECIGQGEKSKRPCKEDDGTKDVFLLLLPGVHTGVPTGRMVEGNAILYNTTQSPRWARHVEKRHVWAVIHS